MELRQVQHVVAVVDHGGVSAAARALYIAQPSLSQSIGSLERELGVRLFDRTAGRMELTEEGREFVARARDLLDRVDLVGDSAHRLRDERARRLVVAVLGTLAIDPLPDLLAACGPEIRDLDVRVEEYWSHRRLVDAVRDGRADVGVTELRTASAGLASVDLGTQEIVLVHPRGAVPPGGVTRLADLSSIAMVVPPSSVGEGILPQRVVQGHRLNVVLECADWDGVIRATRQGVGATLIARPVAERLFDIDQIHRFDPVLVRDVGIVHRRSDMPATAELFVAAARSMKARANGVN